MHTNSGVEKLFGKWMNLNGGKKNNLLNGFEVYSYFREEIVQNGVNISNFVSSI
jgi:hypothetical protein